MGELIPFHPPAGYDFDKLPFPESAFHGSREDQLRLTLAVKDNFPECSKEAGYKLQHTGWQGEHPPICHYHAVPWAGVYEFHMCDGHTFLNEKDEARVMEWTGMGPHAPHYIQRTDSPTVSRLDRMMFVYSFREKLMAEEGLLFQCPICSTIYAGTRHDCIPANREETIPW